MPASAKCKHYLVRAVIRLARTFRSTKLLHLSSKLAANDIPARSQIFYAALRHFDTTTFKLDEILQNVEKLTVQEVLSPLIESPNISRTTVAELSVRTAGSIPAFCYADAMLNRRYTEAFSIWRDIHAVTLCLDSLPAPDRKGSTADIAVVLPGATEGKFGSEIDSAALVGRVGIYDPSPETAATLGTRFDISFLNRFTYSKYVENNFLPTVAASEIVTHPMCKTLDSERKRKVRVSFDLPLINLPTSNYCYLPLRIVPWCFDRGLKPTLYFGDFYLGDSPYQNRGYNPEGSIKGSDDVVLSYFKHDVFFCHAALRTWSQLGQISARGVLLDLLNLDGAALSEILESKWR